MTRPGVCLNICYNLLNKQNSNPGPNSLFRKYVSSENWINWKVEYKYIAKSLSKADVIWINFEAL